MHAATAAGALLQTSIAIPIHSTPLCNLVGEITECGIFIFCFIISAFDLTECGMHASPMLPPRRPVSRRFPPFYPVTHHFTTLHTPPLTWH